MICFRFGLGFFAPLFFLNLNKKLNVKWFSCVNGTNSKYIRDDELSLSKVTGCKFVGDYIYQLKKEPSADWLQPLYRNFP